MNPLAKSLIILGTVILIIGLWIQFGPKVPWLGKLPGDIKYESKNVKIYAPLMTCLLISAVLSAISYFFRK